MQEMRNEGQFQPGRNETAVKMVSLLKSCAMQNDLCKGSELHAYIQEHEFLAKNPYIGNSLVNMYAKCGALLKAQQVLKELPHGNVMAWNALIAGYAQHGQGEEALKCYDSMQLEGYCPDAFTFVCALKACGSLGAMTKGEKVHDKILNLGMLGKNIVLGNALVDMYVKCGALAKAQMVVKELPVRDVITWSTLIAGYAQQGQGEEALKCLDDMQCEGLSPNEITFTCALKACGSVRPIAKVEEIHHRIVNLGMLEKNVLLGSALVDMYAKCGALAKAAQVLEELPVRNVVTWSALIAGYIQQCQGEEALKCFNSMQYEGHFPDQVTFNYGLKACGMIGAVSKGEKIHNKIITFGLLNKDIVLGNTLVDMYAKCGELAKAQQVLEELPGRDVGTWNALIAGYAQHEQGDEALKCFDRMQWEGHFPDVITFTSAIKACGSRGTIVRGEQIHDMIVSVGMLEESSALGNTLVDMYVKCNELSKAQQVLEQLPSQDVVAWNILIAGYAQDGQGGEAMKCFDSMQCKGHCPNAVTFTSALKACASIGAASKGEQIHDKIISLGALEKNIVLGNALVDMYLKCAAPEKALTVARELPLHNIVIWNTLIGGYAFHGHSADALTSIEMMQSNGMKPDSATLLCILNACSHSGLLDQGVTLFLRMGFTFDIALRIEHCSCMVDLFGRVGKFEKALMVIESIPLVEYFQVWAALLNACRKWEEVKIGNFAFEHALYLDALRLW